MGHEEANYAVNNRTKHASPLRIVQRTLEINLSLNFIEINIYSIIHLQKMSIIKLCLSKRSALHCTLMATCRCKFEI